MRRLALPVLLVCSLLVPARADAITIKDLIDLTRAGLGEDILLALIEVDRSVLPIDSRTLKQLKDAGVSERVILAVIRSGRMPPPPPVVVSDPDPEPLPPAPPQVVVIEHREPAREVPVQVPVYLAVPGYWPYPRYRDVEEHRKPVEPVYWGHGGKLRPDAWKPAPAPAPAPKKSGG